MSLGICNLFSQCLKGKNDKEIMREIQAPMRQANLLAMSWWKHVRETFTYKSEQKKVKDFVVTKVCFLLQIHKDDALILLQEWRRGWRVTDTTHTSTLLPLHLLFSPKCNKQKYNLRSYLACKGESKLFVLIRGNKRAGIYNGNGNIHLQGQFCD